MFDKREANFYKLSSTNFSKIFPKLVEAIVAKKNRILIYSTNDIEIQSLDNLLWTYSQLSFLPHGTCNDNIPQGNLVYITNKLDDNQNNANFVVIMEDIDLEKMLKSNFEKYIFFYDHTQEAEQKQKAQALKSLGLNCTFIFQNNIGKWEKSHE